MVSAITAIGTANPPCRRSQQETSDFICAHFPLTPTEKRLLKSIYKATGIEYRHSIIGDYGKMPDEFTFFPTNLSSPFPRTAERMKMYQAHAPALAICAIKKCLSQLKQMSVADITHLITVSCTGMYAPGIDIDIIQQLQLNPTTERTAINFMGCYGAFNAFKVANAICKANPSANVLIVCIEICTIHFQQKMTLDNLLANAIFSDGAAAILVQGQPQQDKYLTFESFYCDLLPNAGKAMSWHIADEGFDIVLSSYIPDLLKSSISDFFHRLLHQANITTSDIDLYAIHPGGIKILQACEAALAISKDKNKYAYEVLQQFGNMSSATIPFLLKKIFDDLTTSDHHKTIFSCAFGPGLTLESMLLKAVNL